MRAALFTIVLGISTTAVADRAPEPPPSPPQTATPEGLDRAAITTAMASIKPKVMSCGASQKGSGTVKVTVAVAPDGHVTSATTNRDASDPLGACVAAAVKSVRFKKTPKGGTFSYPFVFGAPVTESPGATTPVEDFDRAAIAAGIAAVKSKVALCGDKTKATGKVKMRIVVGADGRVTNVTVEETPEAALGACVAGVLQKATFKKTQSGGSFSYPFVFGTPAPTPPPSSTTATALDRSMITDGMAKLRSKISACGTGAYAKAKGTVKVKITVAPAGSVTNAEVVSTPVAGLGACVAGVIASGTFAATQTGGSFSYPFVF
jgi:hypothetical protein